MRSTSGRIRYLTLAIAAAIALPANIPPGMGDTDGPRAVMTATAGTCEKADQPTPGSIQSLKARLAWQGHDRPLRDDRITESDEGDERDDSRYISMFICFRLAANLPSLIPACILSLPDKTTSKPLPLEALKRLRC